MPSPPSIWPPSTYTQTSQSIGLRVDTIRGRGTIMYAWPPGTWDSYNVAHPAWTLGVQLDAGGLAVCDEFEVIEVSQ